MSDQLLSPKDVGLTRTIVILELVLVISPCITLNILNQRKTGERMEDPRWMNVSIMRGRQCLFGSDQVLYLGLEVSHDFPSQNDNL